MRQIENVTITLFTLIVLLIVGCKEHGINPATNSLDTSVLSPLVPGDQWIYDVSTFDSKNNPVSESEDTVTIGLSMTISGERWYFIKETNPPFTDLFTNRTDGLWFINNELSSAPFLVLKYPAATGEIFNEQWSREQTRDTMISIHTYVKVLSTDEEVTAAGKTFLCYHYRSFSDNIINGADTSVHNAFQDQYYSPGVGRIRMIGHTDFIDPVTKQDVRNGTMIETLKSYIIK